MQHTSAPKLLHTVAVHNRQNNSQEGNARRCRDAECWLPAGSEDAGWYPTTPAITIPAFNTLKPWTPALIVYWSLLWLTLTMSFAWTVYTLDVWPLAVWCAFSITAVIGVRG